MNGVCTQQPSSLILGKHGEFVGDWSGGGTPGPISNPAVKSTSTDGSMRVAACESRSLPTSSPFSLINFTEKFYPRFNP